MDHDPVGGWRLTRFDGHEFKPVGPGSLTAEAVLVFVHGWAPGLRVQHQLLALTEDGPVHAWDHRLVDARGRSLVGYAMPLLTALADRHPDAEILWYSWADDASTDLDVFSASASLLATQVNGRRLAAALQAACGPHTRPRVHLIGHSHGSAVAAHAALAMTRRPMQLTMLDAPEDFISRIGGAADLVSLVLPRLRVGREPGTVFVDSYASVFGRSYHRQPGLEHVVDVRLTPPAQATRDTMRALTDAHVYAVSWYARTVSERLGVGYGWSPLVGGDPQRLRPAYVAPQPSHPGRLVPRIDPVPRLRIADADRRRPLDPAELVVAAGTARALRLVTEPGDHLLEFDLEVEPAGGPDHESLAVHLDLDGVPTWVGTAADPVPWSGRYLLIGTYRGEHLLQVRMTGAAPGTTVRLSNLRLVNRRRTLSNFAPQDSAKAMIAAGAVSGGVAALSVVAASWGAAAAVRRIVARFASPSP